MKKTVKVAALVLACLICVMLLTVLIYVLYVVFQYNRIDDNFELSVNNNVSQKVSIGDTYTVMTFNIGFGAYDSEFSFFMDSAMFPDGTVVYGLHGKARDKDSAELNTNGAITAMAREQCDFFLLQEVDTQANRSFFVNQYQKVSTALGLITNYANTFAVNYDSAYLFYPFGDPIGKSQSGLATYSRFAIESSIRRQLPLDTGFAKFFDLDRCIAVNRLAINGSTKQLVLINLHMSAYDEGGTIRKLQLDLLNDILSDEYALGNFVIVGGDFNHDIAGFTFETDEETPNWAIRLTDESLASGFNFVIPQNHVATCRNAATPYEEGKNFRVVLDGFIVSDNITATSLVVDEDFAFSDHNPVVLTFVLNG